MRVCYTTHASNLTGASQSLLDILSNIRSYGVDPIVLLRQQGPLERELELLDVQYNVIPYANSVRDINRREPARSLVRNAFNALELSRVVSFMREQGVDLVHNNSFMSLIGMRAARIAGIPYICHFRDMIEEDHLLTHIESERLVRDIVRDAAHCIAISEFVEAKYSRGVSDGRIEVLHDSVATEKYLIPNHVLFADDTVRILMAGTLHKEKRQIDAIKAVEMLQKEYDCPIELILAGADADESGDAARKYVSAHGLDHISIVGFVDLYDIRKQCDICLMCSTNEALGRVTIEGMLAGCLVVGANAGATSELISDGVTGYLYEACNPRALALTIKEAIDNVEKSRRIALNGQMFAKGFDSDTYCRRLSKQYVSVVSERGN